MSTTTANIASVNSPFLGKNNVTKGYQQNLVKNFYNIPNSSYNTKPKKTLNLNSRKFIQNISS